MGGGILDQDVIHYDTWLRKHSQYAFTRPSTKSGGGGRERCDWLGLSNLGLEKGEDGMDCKHRERKTKHEK